MALPTIETPRYELTLPSQQKKITYRPFLVKEEKILKIFGPAVLQPNLWHINKKSVSRAFAIGAFCAFLPIPGQMILASFLSITFAANIPIAVILTWITNPLTYTPIFYFAYKIGKVFVNIPTLIPFSN